MVLVILISGNKYSMGWKSDICFQSEFWFSGETITRQSFYGMFQLLLCSSISTTFLPLEDWKFCLNWLFVCLLWKEVLPHLSIYEKCCRTCMGIGTSKQMIQMIAYTWLSQLSTQLLGTISLQLWEPRKFPRHWCLIIHYFSGWCHTKLQCGYIGM